MLIKSEVIHTNRMGQQCRPKLQFMYIQRNIECKRINVRYE